MIPVPLLGAVVSGGAVPVLAVIGLILIIVGVVNLFRERVLMGVVMIVIGIFLGGLTLL